MSQEFTVVDALNAANPNSIGSALQNAQLGTSIKKIKATITGLTATAAPVLTAIPASNIVINSGPDSVAQSLVLPPLGNLLTLRVTASGTANSLGSYAIGSAAATPISPTAGANVGLAALGDDQATLTFPSTITAFEIEYFAAPGCELAGGVWSLQDLNAALAQPSGGVGI